MSAEPMVEPKPRRRYKTVLIGVGIALGATVVSAVAFAAWTTTGSGTAAGKAGTAGSITIHDVTPTGDLYPGVNGTASFYVTNNNNYEVKITQFTFDRGNITVTPGGCGATMLKPPVGVTAPSGGTYTVSVPNGQAITVPANTAKSETFTLPNAFSLDPNAPDACQGAVFVIKISAVAATSA